MNAFLKRNLLGMTVFVTGGCVLVVEVVAVRVLSPYFGTTIFTVSSVISVILAALSLGYYFGGRLADRWPKMQYFFGIIMASGLAVLAFYLLGVVVLADLSKALSLTAGPLVASGVLFFLPALLLGHLSPYAVKLQSVLSPDEGVGTVAGRIFFWSTLGSICGSLLAGFVLIPTLGIDKIFMGVGGLLFGLGLAGLFFFEIKKKVVVALVLVAGTLLAATVFLVQPNQAFHYLHDGIYEKIGVYDGVYRERPTRFFQQDRSSSGAMFLDAVDEKDLVYDYTKYYAIYEDFGVELDQALVIGGGAYSIPKAILASDEDVVVDVAEIEPELYEVAKEFFDLEESERLRNFAEDGRRFLSDSEGKYDMIFSDVYYSLYSIPAHFTTVEFFQLAYEKLDDGGIFVANLIGDLGDEKPSLVRTEMKTFMEAFDNSYFFAVRSPDQIGSAQNIIFVGYKNDEVVDFVGSEYEEKLIEVDETDLAEDVIFTDNYAPAEYFTAKVLE